MKSTRTVWDEPETWRAIGVRRPPRDTEGEAYAARLEQLTDEEALANYERAELERAADRVEEASIGYEDWRGFPLEGFESPRYLSERQREYKSWYRGSSPAAARARRIHEGFGQYDR